MRQWETSTSAPEETRRLGALLGELAGAGQVLLLNGELGAGKTCFAQGVAVGLGVPATSTVTSPSYTLLNIHLGRLPLYHFDLYRLAQVDDLADLGYDEYAEGGGLTLVEWADRLTTELAASVNLKIEPLDEGQRRFRFTAMDNCGEALLGQVAMRWTAASRPGDGR